jgi:hypothetical protein
MGIQFGVERGLQAPPRPAEKAVEPPFARTASRAGCPMIGMAGIAAFFVVGLVVSIRLLRVWHETHRMPELLAGLGLLGIGPLGFCVLMVGGTFFRGTPLGHLIGVTGLGIQDLGFVASVLFTWRVFRPSAGWARALAVAIGIGLAVSFASFVLVPATKPYPQFHFDIALKFTTLGWGAFEALRYWRVARQRVAIGFADPLVSASFLAWGVALASAALGFLIIYVAILALEPGQTLGNGVQLLLSLCGIVTAIGLYLSLLPPKTYARHLAESARQVAAG